MPKMVQEASPIEKEFLIKTVVMNEHRVRFHGITTTATGIITVMDRNRLSVRILDTFNDEVFSPFEHLTGYFDCHGRTYAFQTTVRESAQNVLSLDPPEKLLKSLQRNYVRIRFPRTISANFSLANEEIRLDYPICPEYLSFDDESQFSETGVTSILGFINSFKEQAQLRSTANTIVMFRTKKPSCYEEELISRTGKVLYIPSTSSGLPKIDPYPEGRIITEGLEEKFESPDYFVTGSRFDSLLAEKKRKGIVSEIWCPILYYQYVIGYVYLANRDNASFDLAMIEFAWDFSRVLAYQLKKTGYFQHETKKRDPIVHQPNIVDISPGGMLISLPKNDIRTPVKEGCIFKVCVNMGKSKFSGTAKVLRRFEDTKNYFFGTSFINLPPEQIMALYEALYGHPYSVNDPMAHEKSTGFTFKNAFS